MNTVFYSGRGAKKLVNEMLNLEEKLGIDFGVERIDVVDRWPFSNESAYFDNRHIVIGKTADNTKVSLLWHELFHALCYHYGIKRNLLNPFGNRFHDDTIWDGICYNTKSFAGKYYKRKQNNPSGYADVNAEECAAECFALLLSNNFDLRYRYAYYDNQSIDLHQESKLKRKLKRIKQTVNHCKTKM